MKIQVTAKHASLFGPQNARVFFAPGRVNLIGEHTDYNGGHVFPCALKRGTYASLSLRQDMAINMYSLNFEDDGVLNFEVSDTYVKGPEWTRYTKGILSELAKLGHVPTSGFDMVFSGNIPNGSGLSSSASLEMVMATAMNAVFNFGLSPVDLVKLAQRAENNFVGVNCGIMDQFIIGVGKENHAILLDTNSLSYDYAKISLGDYALVIANTNKQRGLADSKYNERRDECTQALALLQQVVHVDTLGQLSEDQFDSHSHVLTDPILYKRAKHAVYENRRTLKALNLLNQGDLIGFGSLMNDSHTSLRHDYEVTGRELDTLVDLSQGFDGVIGSRMTGAGFGGCTVTLIKKTRVADFIDQVGQAYKEAIGYGADFYEVETGDGARELV